jgi:hypothetical protein
MSPFFLQIFSYSLGHLQNRANCSGVGGVGEGGVYRHLVPPHRQKLAKTGPGELNTVFASPGSYAAQFHGCSVEGFQFSAVPSTTHPRLYTVITFFQTEVMNFWDPDTPVWKLNLLL